jgi:hypothetical protein
VNWEVILLHILAILPATVFAAAALIQAIKTHKSVNSRMDELLNSAKAVAALEAQNTIAKYKKDHGNPD